MLKIFQLLLNKSIALFTLALLSTNFVQAEGNLYWEEASKATFNLSNERKVFPDKFLAFHLAISSIRTALALAPKEHSKNLGTGIILAFPMPDGTYKRFSVFETQVMDPQLAAKYALIKTYVAIGVDDPYSWMRLDIGYLGFHAMASTLDGFVFIDPVNTTEIENYICYYKKEMPNAYERHCSMENKEIEDKINQQKNLLQPGSSSLKMHDSGDELRTYRLALACTGEYAATKGGTVPGALSGMVTTINRVDGIYENEVAVSLILIANTDTLIFLNSTTDPYTNFSGSSMLSENQVTVTARIGAANYDIGHVFSTGGGGIAGLGVVCDNSQKASGVTGLPNPVGDAFDVDYVAHEIGHQFGGDHTFNSNTQGLCTGNASLGHNYEPGSGSTIMAYAGICSSHNLQLNSDALFHVESYNQILNYTVFAAGNSCAAVTFTNNSVPIINPTNNYIIPYKTPFILTGSASDADGDALTYIWEEYDFGPFGSPNSPQLDAAIFRDYTPSIDSTRTFPKLSSIINNTSVFGEILPTYARTLHFKFTARDNRIGGGGVANNFTPVLVDVINTSTPFEVTLPNSNSTLWNFGTPEQVTWNVSSTDLAPINCSNVNILLSLDGGFTFPYLLSANTANDGNEMILIPISGSIPNSNTNQARIKVESVGNIFFDMSNSNFSIQNPNSIESIESLEKSISLFPNPSEGNLCIELNSFFTGNVSISVSDCLGRVILREEHNKQTNQLKTLLNLSSFDKGVYFVEVKTAKNSVSKRLLKF